MSLVSFLIGQRLLLEVDKKYTYGHGILPYNLITFPSRIVESRSSLGMAIFGYAGIHDITFSIKFHLNTITLAEFAAHLGLKMPLKDRKMYDFDVIYIPLRNSALIQPCFQVLSKSVKMVVLSQKVVYRH